MSLPEIEDFHRLFLDDIELLDVRAPVEFEQGAFPSSRNMPLMNDDERQQVGLCYKNQGQDKAIELGHKLVSGEVKDSRIKGWADYFKQHPDAALYCFRGGMRSKITQQWLYDITGQKYPRVKGGYKALRQFLLQQLDEASKNQEILLLSGRTGVGKTILLQQIEDKIDLEGIYHHRGSVFGTHVEPQPAQIDIENKLAIQLLKFQYNNISRLVFEDESACIGARRIPENIFNAMREAPIVLLETSSEERIEVIFDEYITQALSSHLDFYGEETGFENWAAYLSRALDKIQRRLGGELHKELSFIMQQAIQDHLHGRGMQGHKDWISRLLLNYYDPMYDYQLSKKQHRVVFTGNHAEMLDYLRNRKQIN